MTARNFSEDGAVGAMTGSPAGSAVGGFQPSTSSTGAIPEADSFGGGGWGGGGFSGGGTESQAGPAMGGGFGGGGLAAPARGNRSTPSYSGDWRDQINQNKDWATPWAGMAQDTGGFQRVAASFSEGGAIDENAMADPNATDPQGSAMGASLQNSINQALTTVNGVLSYGRKLHGLGGGQKQAMNTEGFNQSENVEDRRDSDPTDPNPTGMSRISQNVSENASKIGDRVRGVMAPDPTKNKMSQDAGINDLGSGGESQAGSQQAIPTDEEEAQ